MDLKVEGLGKTISGTMILDDISVEMEGGTIYGLWGKNGSGKTMLMRCLAGLVRPTQGRVCVGGVDLGAQNAFPQSMGLLIETPGIAPEYSGMKNLKILAEIKNIATEKEISALMEELGLDPKEKKAVRKYSLGMKQKLGIAAALMEKPDIIILDEPFNALDVKSVETVQRLLKARAAAGALVLLSCHDREELFSIAEHVFVMENGSLQDYKEARAS